MKKLVQVFKELDRDGLMPLVVMVGGPGVVGVVFGIVWTIGWLINV